MPHPAAARKPRRFWLVAPYILLALVAVAWSGWWLYLRGEVERRMDETVAAMKADGYSVSWARREVGGYPFRVSMTLTDAKISEPSGYGLSAPVLEAEAAAYTINPIAFAAPQGAVITRPGGKGFSVKGRTLVASISQADRTPPRIAIQGTDLVFGALEGAQPLPFSAMKIFEARVSPGDGDKANVFVRLDQATPVNKDDILGRIANGAPVTIGVEGTVNGASFLRGDGWADVLKTWGAAKGSVTIAKGGLMAGQGLLSVLPSTLSVDANGYVTGDLSVSLTSATQGVMALGAVGVIPKETAAVASGLTGVQSGGRPLEATFTFRDGQTWLGPLSLLTPAPRVY